MAPVLFGFPNIFAGTALRLAPGPLDDLLDCADVVLVREPWQVPAVLDKSEVPVVYSSHNVETDRFDRMEPPFYSLVRDRVRELERVAIEDTVATVCTSKQDAEMYRELFEVDSPLFVAPNGTSRENIRQREPHSNIAKSLRRRYGISPSTTVAMFVGSDYGPNVKAANHVLRFAQEIEDRDDPFHFLIVGEVGNAIESEQPNVTVTGFVEEFEGHFDLADVALNPMTSGGGTNIKVFDYFARAIPTLSTPFGMRGIEATPGEEVFITAIDEFPSELRRIRSNPKQRKLVGDAAQSLVETKYTWEQISENLYTFLESLRE